MTRNKLIDVKDKLEKVANNLDSVETEDKVKKVEKTEHTKLASDKVLDFVTFYSLVEEEPNDSSRV